MSSQSLVQNGVGNAVVGVGGLTAPGGYGNQGDKDSRKREVVWFSPHCLKPMPRAKMDLSDENAAD